MTDQQHDQTTANKDKLSRFLFDESDIRGQVVTLTDSLKQMLALHHYPPQVQKLLSEAMCAVSLMSSTLKFEGNLSLQIIGDSTIRLLHAQVTHQHQIRGIARLDESMPATSDFLSLIGQGQIVITIEPKTGHRYQGIVPLSGISLAECLQAYFEQSEQLATTMRLHSGEDQSFGVMLQRMPSDNEQQDEHWQHINVLLKTLSTSEMETLDGDTVINRLFHAEKINQYSPSSISFACSCSRERTLDALVSIGSSELDSLLAESPVIEMTCEYCNTIYQFTSDDIGHSSDTRH